MSVSAAQDIIPEAAAWPRKRKRNNSSVSLPEGVIPPLSTPDVSPKQTNTVRQPLTPPLNQHHISSPSSARISSTYDTPTSPVVARSLGPDFTPSGSQSPRTAVARRLSNLDLTKSGADTESDCTPSEVSENEQQTNSKSALSLSDPNTIASNTPGRPSLHHASSSNQRPKKRLPPPRGIKSPPPKGRKPIVANAPPEPQSPSSSSSASAKITAISSPSPSKSAQSLDLSLLTWQDSEITGHLMLDADDDGYGINGIGFKPTAAMASARSQRRRQQLTAWRTREEREERERRAEKRRQGRVLYGSSTAASNDFLGPVPTLNLSAMAETMDKKMVRFAV